MGENKIEDDLPLVERLKLLQQRRRIELFEATAKEAAPVVPPIKVKTVLPPEPKKKTPPTKQPTLPKIKRDPGALESKIDGKKNDDNAATLNNVTEAQLKKKQKKDQAQDDVEDEDDDEFKWWIEKDSNADEDDSIKWTTLEHQGLYFPPEYVPHGIPLRYRNEDLYLEAEAEECATFFAAILGTDHYENEIFVKNFFEDFKDLLKRINSCHRHKITTFSDCDFGKINQHLQELKDKKKVMTKEEKEAIKKEKLALEERFGVCLMDGRKERVGNFRVEPPGLFRGRGKHPKAGRLKSRVLPEQITINIGPTSPVPPPPPGHQWGKVIHDPTVTWLATWIENINKSQKYVFLAAGSSLKGQSDWKKFETARLLKVHVSKIRADYREELRSKDMATRQRATALWLIDHLALRAGNEKGDEEADTVGCCSLRLEHISLVEPSSVCFDFLGKDSIRYHNEVEVEAIIYKNLGIFMRSPKGPEDPVFDRLSTTSLNKYLSSLMPGLTAKVFRTYNASHTFQKQLDMTPENLSIPELVLQYNRANREVAILCNHQRSIPKGHGESMLKLENKLRILRYERHLVREELKKVSDVREIRKEIPESFAKEEGMDAREKKRCLAIFKEMEKEPVQPPKKIDSLKKRFISLSNRIDSLSSQLVDRDEGKATALGTSKTNYIDPRITTSWCKKWNVPIEKMFNKSLRDKFKWALESGDADWKF